MNKNMTLTEFVKLHSASTSSTEPDPLRDQFLEDIEAGLTIEQAAHDIGITREQLETWIDLDPAFATQARRARSRAVLAHIRILSRPRTKDGPDWRASAWWLKNFAKELFDPGNYQLNPAPAPEPEPAPADKSSQSQTGQPTAVLPPPLPRQQPSQPVAPAPAASGSTSSTPMKSNPETRAGSPAQFSRHG